MLIDWSQFTPWQALTGGMMIGLAAAILMAFNGRILGISGITGTLLPWKSSESTWKMAFLVGLIASPMVWRAFQLLPSADVSASPILLVIAGLLVGFGTRLASGCTSGHGVCGLSRLSLRSLIATLSFMLTGVITVYITRHVLGA